MSDVLCSDSFISFNISSFFSPEFSSLMNVLYFILDLLLIDIFSYLLISIPWSDSSLPFRWLLSTLPLLLSCISVQQLLSSRDVSGNSLFVLWFMVAFSLLPCDTAWFLKFLTFFVRSSISSAAFCSIVNSNATERLCKFSQEFKLKMFGIF